MDKGITVGWPKGMNNIVPDFEVGADMLRSAVNVDILDGGGVRRRKGSTLRLAAPKTHSFWSDGKVALFVSDGNLMRLLDNFTAVLLRAQVGSAPMRYEDVNGDVYYSNGTVCGKVVKGAHREWGVEAPTAPPLLGTVPGLLEAGTYQAVCTFLNDLGEESACARTSRIALMGGAGLQLTLPQPESAEVAVVRVYLTQPNGDVLYQVADVPVAQAAMPLLITATPRFGPACRTQFLLRMLPGEAPCYYRGRIYTIIGNALWHTQPLAYGLTNPSSDFLLLPGDITMVAAVEDGLYIACGKTYFLAGTGPENFELRDIFPFGAARGSNTKHVRSNDVLWYSDRGIVLGSDGGKATLLQAEHIAPDAHTRGATIIKEHDSLNQVVSVVKGDPGMSTFAAMDYMEAEIIRAKG